MCMAYCFVKISPTVLGIQNKSPLQKIRELTIPSITNEITIYYSPGYQKRALKIRDILEGMKRFYEDNYKLEIDLCLAVLNAPHWIQVVKNPFGLPGVIGNPPVVIMPATANGVIYDSALKLKEKISDVTIHKIHSCGFTFEEGAREFVDLIGLHELGHIYIKRFGIYPPKLWLNELLATYFSYAFLRQTHPNLADLWVAMATEVYIEGMSPKYRSLEDFERLYSGVGSDNYAWYQAMFNKRVAEIYSIKTFSFLEEVKPIFSENIDNPINNEALINKLEQIAPGFQSWSRGFKI